MKSIKLKAFLLILAAFTLTLFTCENTDEMPQDQDTDNTFLMRSMSELMGQFDDNGDSDDTQNPSGNMVMDFCFEFVFPIDFYLSNNTITTINSIEELVEVLINSDDDLYINDISYPFDVLVFNDDTNSIESLTIENDEVFASLLDACAFDQDDDNVCYEIYDPVCVEINNIYNETIILVYPNDCYAGLDGFSEEDFLDDCASNYDDHDGLFDNDCFDLVYPIVLVNSNGDTVTINSEEALLQYIEEWYAENCNNLDDCTFDFDVAFPITVEYYSENNQQFQTIEISSEEELESYVEEYCASNYDDHDGLFDNDCFDLVYPIVLVNSNGDTVTINSEEALSQYVEQWYADNCDNLDDCTFDFDIVFPITVEYYSENNQQFQTIEISSEEELESYLEDYCD